MPEVVTGESVVEPTQDWRAPWSKLPKDENGKSLAPHTRAFRKGLLNQNRDELKKCMRTMPGGGQAVEHQFSVSLFIESTETGFVVRKAVDETDTKDVYAIRCVELAMEKTVSVSDSVVQQGGQPFLVVMPLILGAEPSGPMPVEEVQSNGP